MTRKLMIATLVFVLTAGVALSGMLKGEETVVQANVEEMTAAPAFGVCDGQFVRNVRVRSLDRSDFEVTWDYAPPDPCLVPASFTIVVNARRRIGGSILGTKTLTAAASARRTVAEFRSIAGIDRVDATVNARIILNPPAGTGSFEAP